MKILQFVILGTLILIVGSLAYKGIRHASVSEKLPEVCDLDDRLSFVSSDSNLCKADRILQLSQEVADPEAVVVIHTPKDGKEKQEENLHAFSSRYDQWCEQKGKEYVLQYDSVQCGNATALTKVFLTQILISTEIEPEPDLVDSIELESYRTVVDALDQCSEEWRLQVLSKMGNMQALVFVKVTGVLFSLEGEGLQSYLKTHQRQCKVALMDYVVSLDTLHFDPSGDISKIFLNHIPNSL